MDLKIENKKVYVVSDIHNDAEKFRKLLESISFTREDVLIVDGDVFDRGESPFEIHNEVRSLDNTYFITGNHDKWLSNRIHYEIEGRHTGKYMKIFESFDLLKKKMSDKELLDMAKWIDESPLFINLTLNGVAYQIAHAQTFEHPGDVNDPSWFYMGNNLYREFQLGLSSPSYCISIVGHTPTFDGRIRKSPDGRVIFIDCGNGYREYDSEVRLGAIRLNDMHEYYI